MERAAAAGSHAILLGVSGGPDSVYLARAAVAAWQPYHPRLVVACVDHGVRADSVDDVAFTARLAAELSLPFRALQVDPSRVFKAGRVNEARLRAERYRSLELAAREHGSREIWLAHHRDDQVETVILAALRSGTRVGLAALAGMRRRTWRRDGLVLVRPLLSVLRSEIANGLAAWEQPFRSDPTNLDPRFLRNHVRHVLLPRLRREFGDDLDGRLLRIARLARVALRRAQRRATADPRADDGDALHARLVAIAAASGKRPTHRFTQRAKELLNRDTPSRLDLTTGLTLEFREQRIAQVALGDSVRSHILVRECERPDLGSRTLGFLSRSRRRGNHRRMFLDAERIVGSLRTRTRRPGDRVHLLHRQNEHKLKDLFADAKLPRARRAAAHVFVDDLGIVAVEGLGIAKRVAVAATTRRVVRLQFVFDQVLPIG